MTERRVFERIGASLKIKYEILEKAPALKKADSEDVSGGGIKLALGENLALGTNLKLSIEMPGEKNWVTTAYGKIAWVRKVEITGAKSAAYYETGIEFTRVDPLVLGRIFRYFEERKK